MAAKVKGRCNCGSIIVSLTKLPSQSLICHCRNCQRAGAAPFTVNYSLDTSSIDLQDPKGVLKTYVDSDTKSGNSIYRKFCGNCGSPVMSQVSPNAEMAFLKGGLFNYMPKPGLEVFENAKLDWVKVVKADGGKKKP